MRREHHIRRDQQLKDRGVVRGPERATDEAGAEIDGIAQPVVRSRFGCAVRLSDKGVRREVDVSVGEVAATTHARGCGEDEFHGIHPFVFGERREVEGGVVVCRR